MVALDGPPFVINHIISKILNDNNVPTNPRTKRTLLRFGNVIKRNCWIKLAPSTFEASYISLFMELSPERIINAKNGLHLHEFIRTKLIKALFGELKKPVASSRIPTSIRTELITPLLLLNINFQMTTITTVGTINDKIIQFVLNNKLDGVDVDLEWDAVTAGYSNFVLELKQELSVNGKGMTAAFPSETKYSLITCIDKLCQGVNEACCQQTKLNWPPSFKDL